MATAQQLVDLSTQLTGVVNSINNVVGKQSLPFDAATTNLSNHAFVLAAQANTIGQAGLDALANDVRGALAQLTTQVGNAQKVLTGLTDAQKALNIVGSVLAGAASIVASVSTGNWIGAAGDVIALANKIQSTVSANK